MLMLGLLIGLVIWMGNKFGDGAGVIGVGALVVLLAVLFCKAWSDESKAYGNWVEYWKEGGPRR